MTEKLKVVVVGNGNIGANFVDGLVERAAGRVEVTLYGDEEVGTYDRIRLSEYLAGDAAFSELGTRQEDWYEQHDIDLRIGVRVTQIDTTVQWVLGSDDKWVDYDRLVLATGSSSHVPEIPGRIKDGVFVFRTLADAEDMLENSPEKAVIVGGGLLGLEAAYGLLAREAEVTVLHRSGHLMNRQIDLPAGIMLKREMEKMGVGVRLNTSPAEIMGNGRVEGLRTDEDEELPADMVVVCTGIRPNVQVVRESGIETDRGVVVDDRMRTSAEHVFAIGECAEHNGVIQGVVSPGLEQARVVLNQVLDKDPDDRYRASVISTSLKVMGIDLISAGDVYGAEPGTEAVVSSNPIEGRYRKAVVRDGITVGGILFGDISGGAQLSDAVRRGTPAEEVSALVLGSDGDYKAPPLPDDAQICGCNGVNKGQVLVAIQEKGCNSVSAVGAETKAGTSCGSCKPLVKEILDEAAEGPIEEEKNYLCKCMELTQTEVKGIIREREIKSVSELGQTCGAGKVCPTCKPKLAFVMEEVNLNRQKEERHARLINDRVHGNIQNDGTFSIVPRTRGGVTNPDELRRIANVAEKYNARMVKITGAQRLDILGVKKEDLPKAWADLDMPSGHAYTKALRQVKTCVGTDFCRFGVGDSTSLGIEIEEALENLYTPAKVKLGASGCPRNCAESSVKDIGLIAIEGGWQIYVGGAAGMDVRKGDVIATVETEQEAKRLVQVFFQYYRENAEFGERTYDFVPRVGLEEIQAEIMDEETSDGLMDRLERAKAASDDPWKERDSPMTNNQFVGTIGRK
ncbi:NADPH-nitrite reductase [soil metagenome]